MWSVVLSIEESLVKLKKSKQELEHLKDENFELIKASNTDSGLNCCTML